MQAVSSAMFTTGNGRTIDITLTFRPSYPKSTASYMYFLDGTCIRYTEFELTGNATFRSCVMGRHRMDKLQTVMEESHVINIVDAFVNTQLLRV